MRHTAEVISIIIHKLSLSLANTRLCVLILWFILQLNIFSIISDGDSACVGYAIICPRGRYVSSTERDFNL